MASSTRRAAEAERRYRLRCIEKLDFPFRGDESVLDSGCGDGGVARLLLERAREVTAVDLEPGADWRDEPRLTFRIADAERLPFPDASFDLVHSKDSLHHMKAPVRALGDYRRVLKPGGVALIIEANRYNPIFYPHMTLIMRHQHFTRRRFQALVQKVFPQARFGAFEAHFAPPLARFPSLQQAIEEGLERFPPFRPFLSYNFAIAESRAA